MRLGWKGIALGLLAVPLISALISPPGAGRALAVARGLPYPAVVAHRGASGFAPEETVPAYEIARRLGADYLELDVQRSADGVLLAVHDDMLGRTTDIATKLPHRAGATVDQLRWDELSTLDAGSWFNQASPDRARAGYAGVGLARLDDVIDVAERGGAGLGGRGPGLYIETKAASRFPGIEADLVAALTSRGWLAAPAAGAPARVIFQSFEADSLDKLRQLAPHVPRVLLVSQEMAEAQGWSAIVAQAVALDADLGPVGYLAWPWYTGRAHRAGRVVHPYTVNQPWQMQLLGFFGADGFFSDRLDLLLDWAGRPVTDLNAVLDAAGGARLNNG